MTGELRIDKNRDQHPFLGCHWRQRQRHPFGHLRQWHGHIFKTEFVRLDFGEVEDVFNDIQQRKGRFADDIDGFDLLSVQIALPQQFDHADHPIHWGANLVAHGRQERRLGAIGLFGLGLGPFQFGGNALALGDVAQDSGKQPLSAHPVFIDRNLERHGTTVLPQRHHFYGIANYSAGLIGIGITLEIAAMPTAMRFRHQ